MKDKFTDLFHERFSGHESEVPSGAWEAINAHLAATSGAGMQGALKDKFTGHEAHVDPGVWQHISSQLGHGAAGAAAGGGMGWIAAGIGTLVLGGGVLYWTLSGDKAAAPTQQPAVAQVQQQAAGPANDINTAQALPLQVTSTPAAANATNENRSARGLNTAVPNEQVTPAAGPATQQTGAPAEERSATATAAPLTDPAPSPLGTRTVAEVMQQLVTENADHPVMTNNTEVAPPPSTNDLPPQPERPLDTPSEPAPSQAPAVADADEPNVFIPNVFSPNGDNINDKLEVKCDLCTAVEVRIFSAKTNELVFKAKDLDHMWDGTLANGQPAEDGYYFYAIEVTGQDGRVRSKGEVVRLFHH